MSKMNLLVDIKNYEGNNANTSQTNFSRNSTWSAFDVSQEVFQEINIPANSTKLLLSAYDFSSDIVSSTQPVAPSPNKERIVIQTEQDKQYIYLQKNALPKTLVLSVGRLLAFEGDDYVAEATENGTKITWQNCFAQDGEEAMEEGDVINVFYNYSDSSSVDDLNSDRFFPFTSVEGVSFYKFVYIEANKKCDIAINGIIQSTIKPVIINGTAKNGYFLKSSDINDVHIINRNDTELTVYYIATK